MGGRLASIALALLELVDFIGADRGPAAVRRLGRRAATALALAHLNLLK